MNRWSLLNKPVPFTVNSMSNVSARIERGSVMILTISLRMVLMVALDNSFVGSRAVRSFLDLKTKKEN